MEVKTTDDMIQLMLHCCNHNPYKGYLSEKETLKEGLNLARICLKFSEDGQVDEAMGFSPEQWRETIIKLEELNAKENN